MRATGERPATEEEANELFGAYLGDPDRPRC